MMRFGLKELVDRQVECLAGILTDMVFEAWEVKPRDDDFEVVLNSARSELVRCFGGPLENVSREGVRWVLSVASRRAIYRATELARKRARARGVDENGGGGNKS